MNIFRQPGFWRLFGNLLYVTRYSIFFGALLIVLPLAAFEWGLAHSLLGGVFGSLSPYKVFWVTAGLLVVAWSAMFLQAILVCGVEVLGDTSADRKVVVRGGPISQGAEQFLNLPQMSYVQLILYGAVALPGIAIIVCLSEGIVGSVFCAIIGIVVTYLTMLCLAYPVTTVDEDFHPMPTRSAQWLWQILNQIPGVKPAFVLLRRLLSLLLRLVSRIPILSWLFDPIVNRNGQLKLEHYFALTNFFLLVVAISLVASFFPPNASEWSPPAGAYLFAALALVMWTLGGLQFFFSRLRLPPLVIVVAIMLIGYQITKTQHIFVTQVEAIPEPDRSLSPVAIVKASKNKLGEQPKNLVVVTATGGGILASGRITIALERLVEARPDLKQEIRLLSTVSGGSTGAAFYLDGLLRQGITHESKSEVVNHALHQIFDASVASSLRYSAYGLAMLDFWRMATGGFLPQTILST